MKLFLHLFMVAILAAGCAIPVLAQDAGTTPQQYQNDQDRDRNRNTQAYADGYAQGQADARGHAIRNDHATAQWTKDDDMRAYRQGYDAGYANIMNNAANPETTGAEGSRMAAGEQQASQFGYQDGLAAGRQDQMKGDKFKPTDHDLYKSGLHGWTATLGTKDEFKQLYRESFMKGYQQGYQGTGPR